MSEMNEFLRDMLRRSPQGASTPPTSRPTPGETPLDLPVAPGTPIERTVERQVIPGTALSFSVSEAVYTGPQGSLDHVREVAGVMAGCHHLISTYSDLGGQCPFCREEALEMVESGATDVRTAEGLTLFCRACRTECTGCRTGVCRRHAVSFQAEEGGPSGAVPLFLCPTCLRQARRARFLGRVLRVIASPFVRSPGAQSQGGRGQDPG
jgi:hypothetical protein